MIYLLTLLEKKTKIINQTLHSSNEFNNFIVIVVRKQLFSFRQGGGGGGGWVFNPNIFFRRQRLKK